MPKNPHANFRPTLESYSGQGAFRFWCQMALPLTFDDSLSYYELLNKVVAYLNNTIEDVGKVEDNVAALNEAYGKLEDYVNTYFDEIDIEAELRNVLDAMAEDGSLDSLLDPLVATRLGDVVAEQISDVVANQIGGAVSEQIDDAVLENLPAVVPDAVSDWLEKNVTPTTPIVDETLTISGAAADAKVTGYHITNLKNTITEIVDFNYIYNEIFSKAKNIPNGNYTNQNVVLTDKIPVQGGSVLTINYDIYASINPSIFSSISLQTIEYDANESVLRRTFSYDTPLTLLDNTAKILFVITYSCSNEGTSYTEIFKGYVKAQNGNGVLNQDIDVPELDYVLGIIGTDGQPW